jgi:hypothetical protein
MLSWSLAVTAVFYEFGTALCMIMIIICTPPVKSRNALLHFPAKEGTLVLKQLDDSLGTALRVDGCRLIKVSILNLNNLYEISIIRNLYLKQGFLCCRPICASCFYSHLTFHEGFSLKIEVQPLK